MRAKVKTIADGGKCFGAAWSPDDKRVVVSWKLNDPIRNGEPISDQQMYTFEPNGDLRLTLLPGQDKGRSNKNPDWSRDGTMIVFSSAERE
jgi:Tol biopolymer transport system component